MTEMQNIIIPNKETAVSMNSELRRHVFCDGDIIKIVRQSCIMNSRHDLQNITFLFEIITFCIYV